MSGNSELISRWCDGEWEYDQASIDWLRSRPESIKQLLIRFPPSCVVRALAPKVVPAPGRLGIVHSFIEPSPDHPDGLVAARDLEEEFFPTGDPLAGYSEPNELEVVAYYKGWTPEFVRTALRVQ